MILKIMIVIRIYIYNVQYIIITIVIISSISTISIADITYNNDDEGLRGRSDATCIGIIVIIMYSNNV